MVPVQAVILLPMEREWKSSVRAVLMKVACSPGAAIDSVLEAAGSRTSAWSSREKVQIKDRGNLVPSSGGEVGDEIGFSPLRNRVFCRRSKNRGTRRSISEGGSRAPISNRYNIHMRHIN